LQAVKPHIEEMSGTVSTLEDRDGHAVHTTLKGDTVTVEFNGRA
jgi:hypothetical protein